MWQWEPWKRGIGYQSLAVLAETELWSLLTSCLVLSNILPGFFLLKPHQQSQPQPPPGVCAALQAARLSSGRELKGLGRH